MLRVAGVESHLVVTPSAHVTREYETDLSRDDLLGLADVVHQPADMAASISSGSFVTDGMIVAPCSMKTLGEIANATPSTLVGRAADVVLKERRRLVLLTRECPLTLAHLRNMAAVTEMGAVVFPPVPAFYSRPQTLEELVDQTVGRALDLFGIHLDTFPRWTGVHRRGPELMPAPRRLLAANGAGLAP